MGGWVSFQRDLLEQLPLILAGLRLTLELTVVISVTGLLFGVVVFLLFRESELVHSVGDPRICVIFHRDSPDRPAFPHVLRIAPMGTEDFPVLGRGHRLHYERSGVQCSVFDDRFSRFGSRRNRGCPSAGIWAFFKSSD